MLKINKNLIYANLTLIAWVVLLVGAQFFLLKDLRSMSMNQIGVSASIYFGLFWSSGILAVKLVTGFIAAHKSSTTQKGMAS